MNTGGGGGDHYRKTQIPNKVFLLNFFEYFASLFRFKQTFYFKEARGARGKGQGWYLGIMADDKRSRISLIFMPDQFFRLIIYNSKVHHINIFKNDKAIVE